MGKNEEEKTEIRKDARKLGQRCMCKSVGISCEKIGEKTRKEIFNACKYEEKEEAMLIMTLGERKVFSIGLKKRSVRDRVTNPTVHGMPRTRDEKKKTIKQIEDNESKTAMISFINSIPKLTSHDCKADLSKLYSEENFKNKTEAYELYKIL
ncbi:hypothetical protein HHI36_006630 [Cryptolaemus montrouzieri]|uniref:Uncharacterized protein n=1 Tax=Cryptolaemus montrouzieri TaxID=559131 RepID=A0ABD2NZ14_9CUCU